MTDFEYISAIRNNNQKAFAEFYRINRTPFLIALKNAFQIYDEDSVLDVYSDACMQVWLNIQNGTLSESTLTSTLSGYLYGIGRVKMLEYLRVNSNTINFEVLENVISEEPILEPEEDLMWEAANRALEKLSSACKQILTAFYFQKLDYPKIVEELNYSSIDSAKTQKNKCMTKLKAEANIQLNKL